jgi:hypothetical protein
MRALQTAMAALAFVVTGAAAQQTPSNPSLSIDQQEKIGESITNKEPAPLTNVDFSVSIDTVVPKDVSMRSLPPEAAELAPQVRGFGYIAVDEQIAIVEQRTRKIVAVIPRWRRQENTTPAR